jgi:hypothetical protein
MMAYRLKKCLKVLLMVLVIATVLSFVVMHLWNWLMPAVFGLHVITFWQALGLIVLGKILFGGFHRHGGGGGRREWKRHMEERWGRMSPEERDRFKAGMREWKSCWPGPGFGRRGFDGRGFEGRGFEGPRKDSTEQTAQ